MARRTTTKSVTFARPFRLAGLEEEFPAGQYDVETDEELLDGRICACILTRAGRVSRKP